MRIRLIKSAVLLTAVLSSLGVSGCTVAPWERGNLAKPQMAGEINPAQGVWRNHIYGSREAATGGPSLGGGGCGCY